MLFKIRQIDRFHILRPDFHSNRRGYIYISIDSRDGAIETIAAKCIEQG